MTPEASAGEPPLAAKPGRRYWFWLGSVLLVATAGAGVWWWRHAAPVDPPMPSDIQDAEVRQALERARQEVLAKPRSADAWGHLGMTLLAHLFDREADRCFAEAARLAPADARWPYGRALIALKRDSDNAPSLLRQAAAVADSWPEARSEVRLQLAETLLERRELEEAEGLFREELRHDPGNLRAAFGLGLLCLARGDERAATEYLTAARASPYARKKSAVQLAALAGGRGDGAAVAAYEKEIAALPDDPPWPDALLDQIIELQVGHRNWEREADQLERAHRYGEVAGVYLKQIKDHPTARAYAGAGINLARIQDYAGALPLLREGVRLDPDSPQAHYALALTQFSRAEKELHQSPGSPAAREWLREALEHARRTTELKPDHASAYLFWGLALKHLGEPAAAVAPLRQGVACRPEMFELQLALGEALMENGQDREAETHLENAHRLDPQDPRPAPDLERLRHKKN